MNDYTGHHPAHTAPGDYTGHHDADTRVPQGDYTGHHAGSAAIPAGAFTRHDQEKGSSEQTGTDETEAAD